VRTRGLGLGLAIVQRLARLLQLRVVLHSRPGCGSVFFVEGLAPAGVAPQAAAASRREWAPAGRRLAGLLVAVLEDDAEVRDAMRLLLQRWDCRVVDGTQADDLLQRLPTGPDAVLADLRLADGRTGPAELQHLQQAWGRAVPVLWISGETAPDGLRAGLPDGAPVLTKPVSPARLLAWLEQRLPPGGPGERS
jgi:CheY-like chemotaxis protein